MKPMLRIFRYLKFFPVQLVFNVLFNLLHILFNLGSYVLIIPFAELMFGMNGADLNSFLRDRKIIYKCCGQWKLAREYRNMGFTETFYKYKHDREGRRRLVSSLVWTNEGRQFLLDIIYGKK